MQKEHIMSQPVTVDALLDAFFEARQPRQNPEGFVEQAEQAGQHQLAKIFRAVIASDAYRDRLMRKGLPSHVQSVEDFYICPHCGLIYEPDAPEQCVADETPAAQFEHIG
jgi:rubrerythrin